MSSVFEREWDLYRQGGDKNAFEAEKPQGKGDFDKDVKPGQIRIFADMKRPFVALVVEERGVAGWLITPVSPFTVLASGREMLVGERVFQLWNSCTAAKSFVERSWIVDTLGSEEVADIAVAVKATKPGRITDGEDAVAQYERTFLVSGGNFVPLFRPAVRTRSFYVFRAMRIAAALAVCGGVAWYATQMGGGREPVHHELAYSVGVGDVADDVMADVSEAKARAIADASSRLEPKPTPMASKPAPAMETAAPQSIDAVAAVKSPVILRKLCGSVENARRHVGGKPLAAAKCAPPVPMVVGGAMADVSRVNADMTYARFAEDVERSRSVQHLIPETERYAEFKENEFLDPKSSPLSTFSLDVDTTSYTLMRRSLNDDKRLPPPNAVRIEEFVNYFHYDYPEPKGGDPVGVDCEMAECPWNKGHKLARIGLQAKRMDKGEIPPCNLTFLIDVSGSMEWHGGIDMVKKGLSMLVEQLREEDRVAIVTYASGTSVRLPSTPGTEKRKILDVIDSLMAGGGTYGAGGIQLAYHEAKKNFDKARNNRVILVTDGDFNIGLSSPKEMEDLIAEKRESGIFLTVLGVGEGNYHDAMMKKLANAGNGNYAYIDSVLEAKKVFIDEFGGTLQTVAKDVKLQIEFNPAEVAGYRLLGYENRALAAKDFNDDKKDAGEMGAGHTMTAFYEIIPAGSEEKVADVDPLKYQRTEVAKSGEIFTVKLRWKAPDGDTSVLGETPCTEAAITRKEASEDFRFASSVAEFALLLENSKFKGDASYKSVLDRARKAKGADDEGYRAEFIRLVEKAELCH